MAFIALIGPGAVGGVISATLTARGGHVLTLCARRAVGELDVDLLGRPVRFAPAVFTDPAQGRPADWVLVCTKAYDCAGAATWFPGLVGPQTRVAILQNGVEHRERFAAWLPAEQILPVMVDIPAERPAPGRIAQRGAGKMIVPAGVAGAEFVGLFAGSHLDVATTPDFTSAVWRKLCLNAPGAINALLLKPAGVFRDNAVGELAKAMARECLLVGRAEGAVLEDDLPEKILANCRAAPPDSMNSLHADRAAGRPMEVDARNGAVVRFGRKHGIATPLNEMAATLLAAG
ncbi:2-dehydropantoate 2-reductase [Oleiharenicola lentus]|uniref:2-dehydropantoate 2-reductase n=1 Tax=Oleiharenicola lentus TaxID=2508720 RepID=A0A4Q1C6W7_9BACT|nr:2-dehydropantoate 2-reductase [Oleiharenicola lentus]RXK54558.1 2-dehydropantoate 2-reductase [Oleiharenicola lentus]